jgi:hypothetical protein
MAGPLAASIKMGPGVFTLGANTYYTDGSIEAGMNADISKGRPSTLSLAVALAITERAPFIKATIIEANATSAADFWDCTAASWGLPADKTPTSVACTAAVGGTTYTLTTGYVSEYGSVSMADGEMVGVAVGVEGFSSDGSTAAGSIVTPP